MDEMKHSIPFSSYFLNDVSIYFLLYAKKNVKRLAREVPRRLLIYNKLLNIR